VFAQVDMYSNSRCPARPLIRSLSKNPLARPAMKNSRPQEAPGCIRTGEDDVYPSPVVNDLGQMSNPKVTFRIGVYIIRLWTSVAS